MTQHPRQRQRAGFFFEIFGEFKAVYLSVAATNTDYIFYFTKEAVEMAANRLNKEKQCDLGVLFHNESDETYSADCFLDGQFITITLDEQTVHEVFRTSVSNN